MNTLEDPQANQYKNLAKCYLVFEALYAIKDRGGKKERANRSDQMYIQMENAKEIVENNSTFSRIYFECVDFPVGPNVETWDTFSNPDYFSQEMPKILEAINQKAISSAQ